MKNWMSCRFFYFLLAKLFDFRKAFVCKLEHTCVTLKMYYEDNFFSIDSVDT